MNTASPVPDEASPLTHELDEPVVKPFEIIWTIAHDRLIPMSKALEILKSVKWEEVEL